MLVDTDRVVFERYFSQHRQFVQDLNVVNREYFVVCQVQHRQVWENLVDLLQVNKPYLFQLQVIQLFHL